MPERGMENWTWPPRYDSGYRPPDDQRCWFPSRETMDPEQRETHILERLQQVIAYAWERAPFYRRKWSQAGFEPGDLRSLEDFTLMPVVTKAELREAQARVEPFGDYLCVNESEVFHVHGTSGTTGRPTAFGISRGDWEAIANAPEGQTDAPGTIKATVLERCREFLDPVQAVIEATEEADVIRTDITDRDPLKRWGDGRVTLLGDAAHPMTHNLGQGGCQAIEDGVVLGKALARATTIESGLRAYEAVRMKRSTRYVLRSRRIGALSKLENPLACAVRDRLLRHMLFKIGGRAQPREMAVEF